MKKLSFFTSYRQQCLALAIGSALLLGLVYTLSIRRTLALGNTHRQMKQNIAMATSAPAQIAKLEQELIDLQGTSLRAYDQEQLLESVTDFCHNNELMVVTFPEAQRHQEEGNQIITNRLTVEGTYRKIVQLVYLLEQDKKLSSVASLRFFTHRDRRTKKTSLRATLILRNLEEV